jgi:hypothetical protein
MPLQAMVDMVKLEIKTEYCCEEAQDFHQYTAFDKVRIFSDKSDMDTFVDIPIKNVRI